MVSIHLALGNFLIREGLKSVCESTGEYKVTSGSSEWKSCLNSLDTTAIDLLVLSTALPGLDLHKDLEFIRKQWPSLRIILIDSAQHKMELQAIETMGIRCILHTDCADKEILKGISVCLSGGRFICSRVTGLQECKSDFVNSNGDPVKISKREEEIVYLIAQGLTSKEISERLILSFHTVSTHRKNIFKKLQVSSATELTRLVLK